MQAKKYLRLTKYPLYSIAKMIKEESRKAVNSYKYQTYHKDLGLFMDITASTTTNYLKLT